MKIYVLNKLIVKRWRGMCIPPIGIFIRRCCDTPQLRKHEIAHWNQYKEMGLLVFYIRYGLQCLIFGYWNSPMEIEARKKEIE